MKTLLTILLLLVPGVAWGTDGDSINGAETSLGSFGTAAFVFCDGKIAASADTCSEFDLQSSGRGMPDYVILSLDSANNCDAGYQVIVNGATTTGGTAHAWGTLDVTNTALVITTPTHRFLAGVTTDAGCDASGGTGLTVNMVLYFRKR